MVDLEIVGVGATTKVYRDGERAIKLYVGAPVSRVEAEAALQTFAQRAGLPVPAVYGVRELDDGAVALEMQYIPGAPIMQEGMDAVRRQDAVQVLVKLQLGIHEVNADGLPTQADMLARWIDRNAFIGQPLKGELLSLLQRLDTNQRRLCHGDFHPLNVLCRGDERWIIDWVNATAGNPLADACRTYLLFRQYISRLAEAYLRTFCREAGASEASVLAWLPVIAAARMPENQDEKARNVLMEMIEAAMD